MFLETREIKLFGRDIPGFCRDIPEVPEKFEKKKFVFNSRPLKLLLIKIQLQHLTSQRSNKQTCKPLVSCLLLVGGFRALYVFKLEIARPSPEINNE